MKTIHNILGMVILFTAASSLRAQTITTTPTDGPTTITIHARTKDGKLPVDVTCTAYEQQGQRAVFPIPQPLSFVGKSGDWAATNVPPGVYGVNLRSPNYAEDSHSIAQVAVKVGNNYSIDFVLSRGATFKGRVLDDATGKPIAKAVVYGMTEHFYDTCTDAEGRYELPHITGTLKVEVATTNHVAQVVRLDEAAEDSTVTVPDIRLQHGGWISGRVESPAGVKNHISGTVSLEIQGNMPASSMRNTAFWTDSFRTRPLPAGTYTLNAKWGDLHGKGGPPPKWRAQGSVSDIKVIVGQDTTNVFIPNQMAAPADNPSGR